MGKANCLNLGGHPKRLSALIALFALFFSRKTGRVETKWRLFSLFSLSSLFFGNDACGERKETSTLSYPPPGRKSPSTALLPDGKVGQLRPPLCPFPLFIFLSMVNYGNFRAGFDRTAVAPRPLALPTHKFSPTNHPRELGLLKTAPLR